MIPSSIVREGLEYHLNPAWSKDVVDRERIFDIARFVFYGVYPEMVPSSRTGNQQQICVLTEDEHRLPFWTSGRPQFTLDQTTALLVSTGHTPYVPFVDFIDAVLARCRSSTTPGSTSGASRMFDDPTTASQAPPDQPYKAAMTALLSAPGLYHRAHPPLPAGGTIGTKPAGSGVSKLKNMVVDAVARIRGAGIEAEPVQDSQEWFKIGGVMDDVIDGIDSRSQHVAWSCRNVENLYRREQSKMDVLKIRRALIFIMGMTLSCMFHGIISV